MSYLYTEINARENSLINLLIFVAVVSGPGKHIKSSDSPSETPKQESPKQPSIDDINEKLKEVRLKRLQLSHASKPSTKKSQQNTTAVAPLNNEKNTKKKAPQAGKGKEEKLHHPDLEYAVEKIMHSPYLTKPTEKYPGEWYY